MPCATISQACSIGGTNVGRDSDTIAGRAAMLAGTLNGAGNVPNEWMEFFSPASLQRIDTNTDKIIAMVTEGKTEKLKQRIEIAS